MPEQFSFQINRHHFYFLTHLILISKSVLSFSNPNWDAAYNSRALEMKPPDLNSEIKFYPNPGLVSKIK